MQILQYMALIGGLIGQLVIPQIQSLPAGRQEKRIEIGQFLSKEEVKLEEEMKSIKAPIEDKREIIKITITGYSSTPEQTDSTPFITASNKHVEDGIVACNFLPFGTEVRFPEIYGEKVFVVEDRMHQRFDDRVDIWFESSGEAVEFGKKFSEMEVL